MEVTGSVILIFKIKHNSYNMAFMLENAAKRDNAGAVCNSSMGMVFFMYFTAAQEAHLSVGAWVYLSVRNLV